MTFIWPLLIAAGIALVIALLLAIFLARSIYRPLVTVTKAAQQISRGDYSQRIKPEGPKEIKELAESFNRMTEDVEQAQLRLRHFVADVSHELRSPLTSIQGFAQALLDGTASDDATKLKAAQIIDEESRRLKHQVDELLELSRMQSNQAKFLKEPVNLVEVLDHCTDVFAVQAKQKQVTIELKADADLIVAGDTDRLEQVFNNLLDNAIKNSPSGGKIHVVSGRAEGNIARTVVSDEGPGIPPDQLTRVFERFYQVTGARTGVGLGLAIAKEIVSAHNGSITASSAPGEGAHFTIDLPLEKR
jgi:two-component system, OmpR family, sensor kinase